MNNNNTPQHWFTSDIHYGHKNVIRYSNRPYDSVEEMDEDFIRRHNELVQPNDIWWSLGDFAFANLERIESILSRLNGQKNMVLGNHCKTIKNGAGSLIRKGLVQQIVPYAEITVRGQFICLFHYGQRVWNRSHHGSWQLFGHSHGTLPPWGKSVDVGVDSPWLSGKPEYRPFNFDEIKKWMDKQPSIAHHDKGEM